MDRARDVRRRAGRGLGGGRRSWPVLAVFAAIIGLQVLVAAISIDVLSAVRAYVTGESLYSKGQKDAQIHLLDYADSHREDDYQKFMRALEVPLGDRVAREAMQKTPPDLAAARRGLLDGATHPDDIPGVIRLFLWFQDVPLMADPIATWTRGDAVIEQMRSVVEKARERVLAGDFDAPVVTGMLEQVLFLNQQMTDLERQFSAQLGETSRQTQKMLLAVNVVLALLLALSGLGFVRRSARRQALTEDEVRRRQESLQRLLDSSAEGLFGVDLQGRCTFINRAALAMLGYSSEAELLGRDIHALIHHSHADGRVHPAGESKVYRAFRQREALHVADEVFWRRDGSSFPVEYWSHPVLENGEVHGAVATFFDITERLTMQAALRQGELRITRLVDAVTDGVITVDVDDRIVLFNRSAEQLFGVAASEAIGGPIERFIPYRPEAQRNGHGERFAPGDGWGRLKGALYELQGRRTGGEEFPIEASLSRLDTDRGPFTTVVLRDVTEQHLARAERQAREALEATSRAKTEFLSRMSHELRTPLNAVLGFSQLLRMDAARPPSPQQLERIQHIENAGAHLLALVNDVLDLSRVDSGQMTLAPEAVDLGLVVRDAVAMVSTLADDAGVDLQVALAPIAADREAWVWADRVRLRQVLVNLLSNAVKYNRAGGSVRVSWQARGGRCRLGIADTGVGIPPEQLTRLFEPFNRLGAEKSKVEGTGIGLVLSRRLVDLMHGELAITSKVGAGTVATLALASAERPTTKLPVRPPPSQHGPLDGKLRVLYAEDNEVNVELVRQVVTLRPAVALGIAENGTSALEMARRDPPDLMLVDMNLGDMTGMELADELRRSPATAGIRLVALSADALPEQIDAALAAGFEGYLTKPVDFRQLLNVLDGRP